MLGPAARMLWDGPRWPELESAAAGFELRALADSWAKAKSSKMSQQLSEYDSPRPSILPEPTHLGVDTCADSWLQSPSRADDQGRLGDSANPALSDRA